MGGMSLYTTLHAIPSADTYRHLRVASGLSPKSAEAAARGLPNTLFAVQLLLDGEPVGMGRVIGDGGTAYQVVDIAVLPEHQGARPADDDAHDREQGDDAHHETPPQRPAARVDEGWHASSSRPRAMDSL